MATSLSKTGQFEKLRLLGALEQFSSARHHLGFYFNVGISASYSCPAELSIPLKDTIFKALATIIEKHPVLSTIPMNEDSPNPYFVRLPSIDLEEAVTFIKREELCNLDVKDTELDRILESQHNRGFQEHLGKLPFWRLIITTDVEVANQFTASFIFHHSLGDGTSGMVFHRDLLSALQSPSIILNSSKVFPPKKDLLSNLELLHPLPIPPIPEPRHVPTNLWSGEKVTMPTSSRFKSLYLSHAATQKFIQTCKKQSTTVTATMPVIVAAALLKIIPPSFEELECTVAVSLRRWMPPSVTGDSFGVWIDAFSQYYRRENVASFSWDEARRSRETITDYLKSGGQSINVAKFQNIKDMRQFFLSRVGKERGTSFDVSNLGGMGRKHTGGGRWKMGRVLFSRSAFVSGSAIAVGVVSGADERLSLGFSWQMGIVSDDLIEKLIQGVYTEIDNLVRPEVSQVEARYDTYLSSSKQ